MIVIDSTQAKTYSACPMKYKLNYIDNLVKVEYEEDSVDIRFGEAIHSALELLDEHNLDPEPIMTRFKNEFVELPGEEIKTMEHGLKLLKDFIPYYKNNFSEWETVEKEQIGYIMLNEKIKYLVKIDRVIRWRDNLYCVDFKTTKSTRKNSFFDKFFLDFQPTGYIKWVKGRHGQCSGFIPIGMFLGYRKRKYKDEPAGFHSSFDHTIINRTKEQIDEWANDIWLLSEEIEQAKMTGNWRRNPADCSSWRGCQYRQLCESSQDEMIKDRLYVETDTHAYLKG